MAHTIDKASLVKSFFVKKFLKIISNLVFITVIMNMLAHIVKHLHNLDIGTAMLRSF